MRTLLAIAAIAGTSIASFGQTVEIEDFESGGLGNPFFQHELEYNDPCCWEVVFRSDYDSYMLHLRPNNDLITFDLPPGMRVRSIAVDLLDFEGGFVGNAPTSAVVVRAASGDFVALHADEIGVLAALTADVDTPGQLTGAPLGEIVSIRLDAANEGNSVVPLEFGGYFDNLAVTLAPVCPGDLDQDGSVGLGDLAILLAQFGTTGGGLSADLDGDMDVDLEDLSLLLAVFGRACA